MDILRKLPYNWHYWMILHFGKPKTGPATSDENDQFKYYELNGWIACPSGQIIKSNLWETYQRWKKEIGKALERFGK